MDAKSTLGLTCSAGVKRAVLFQYVFACDSALTGVNVTFFFFTGIHNYLESGACKMPCGAYHFQRKNYTPDCRVIVTAHLYHYY